MIENDTELSRRLVVGHRRDGRCCYDKEAKEELIEACLQPGVSVARMALQQGINANLLRTWIGKYRRQREAMDMVVVRTPVETAVSARSAFVPVIESQVQAPAKSSPRQSSPVQIGAQLPNGVTLDLSGLGLDEMSSILRMLSTLPCSGLTQD